MKPWHLWLGSAGALGALALIWKGGKMPLSLDEKTGPDGVCLTDPSEIARAHGVTLDCEALARMMVSETPGRLARLAVGSAALNMARRRGESVAALLLRGRNKNGSPSISDGRFGAQNTGKYASTRTPSTPEARADARDLLAGKIADPTGGATQWDAPSTQDAQVAAGAPGYTKTAAQVAAERSKSSELVMVPGVSHTRFWKPKA